MIMNRLIIINWCNNLLIVVLLLCFNRVFCSNELEDSFNCPDEHSVYDVNCKCEYKKVNCKIGKESIDSKFWTEFGHLKLPRTLIELSLHSPDSSSVDYFPINLFTNLAPSINETTISNWKFTSIPPFKVAVTSKVATFTIKGNDYFTTIGPKAFAPLSRNLEKLLLTSNKLSNIDSAAFVGLKKVREISLSNNNLTSLPDNLFQDLSELTELRLFTNKISTLRPAIFRGLTSLKELELHHNELLIIKKDTFRELSRLENLDLSYNHIDSLELAAFNGLKSVTNIDLTRNALRFLPSGLLTYTPQLTQLSLEHNQLTSLSDDFLKQLPKSVFLKDNQWICDCNLLNYQYIINNNLDVKCTASTDEFNKSGKPVQTLEMTIKEFYNSTKKDKQCNYIVNKEKRSHLTMASVAEGQTDSSCSLESSNFIVTVTLNILLALKVTL